MACPSPKLLLLDSARWARARAVVRPKRRVGVQSRARGFSPAPRLRQARRRPALAGRAGHAFGAGNARGPGAVGEAPRACLTAATARATGTACAARATDTVSAANSCGTAEEPSGPTRTAGNTASATVTAVCAVAPVAARPAGPADGVLIAKSTGVATGAAVAAVTASPADSTGPTDSAAATVAAVADQHAAGATLATHATGPRQVTYSVTGTKAPGDIISVTYVDAAGRRRTQHNVYIPWSMTVTPISQSDVGSVEASSLFRVSKLNCSITTSDGTVLSSNSNDGPQTSC